MRDFLDDVIEANRKITGLECENHRLKAKEEELLTTIDAHKMNEAELNLRISDLESETEAAEANENTFRRTIARLQEDIKREKQDRDAAELELKTVRAKLNAELEDHRKANVAQIEAHQAEKEVFEAQIASLKADNTKVKDVNKTIAAQRDDFQTKLSALQVEHAKLRNESKIPTASPKLELNPTLEQGYSPVQELAQAKTRIKHLEKELSDANELFTNLQHELNECKSERDDLQAKLDTTEDAEQQKLLQSAQRHQNKLEDQVKRYRTERDEALELVESLEEELKLTPTKESTEQLHEALDDMRVQWNIAVRAATAYQHDIEILNAIVADLKLELAKSKE